MASWNALAQSFESVMLICFGIGWPVAILKTVRTRRVEGVSLGFLCLILTGYLAGVGSKFFRAAAPAAGLEAVTALYAANALLVGTEIALYLRYRGRKKNA